MSQMIGARGNGTLMRFSRSDQGCGCAHSRQCRTWSENSRVIPAFLASLGISLGLPLSFPVYMIDRSKKSLGDILGGTSEGYLSRL